MNGITLSIDLSQLALQLQLAFGGGKFEENFNLVKNRLADVLHFHALNSEGFPYQLQCNLLMDAGWNGWWLPELDRPPAPAERMPGFQIQRQRWDELVATALKRSA